MTLEGSSLGIVYMGNEHMMAVALKVGHIHIVQNFFEDLKRLVPAD